MSRSTSVLRASRLVPGALALLLASCNAGAPAPDRPADLPESGAPDGREAIAVVDRCELPIPDPADAVRQSRGVEYSTAGGSTLRLDLVRPARGRPAPVVLLLHGGGWEGGSRSEMYGPGLILAGAGYAAASIDYRLTRGGQNRYPAAVQDARCAVRWLRANAARLELDPTRIGVLGFSAGAHLASLLGVAPESDPALDGPCGAAGVSPAVAAVVSVAGPHDLRERGPYTAEQRRLVENFLGVFPGDDPVLAAQASPITRASAGTPPFLLVHGAADALVPVEQSRAMRDALQNAGARATLVELPGVGHTFVGLSTPGVPRAGCTMLAFLERWVRGGEVVTAR